MPKESAGKLFGTAEEAGATPPSEEKLARTRKFLDKCQTKVDAVAEEDRPMEVSPSSGTMYPVLNTTRDRKGSKTGRDRSLIPATNRGWEAFTGEAHCWQDLFYAGRDRRYSAQCRRVSGSSKSV